MNPTPTHAPHDGRKPRPSDHFLHHLCARINGALVVIDRRIRDGWDINVVQQLYGDLGILSENCQHQGAAQIAEQLIAIKTALAPAAKHHGVPGHGVNALLAALASHLRELLANDGALSRDNNAQIAPLAPAAGSTQQRAPQRVLLASIRPALVDHLSRDLTAAGFRVRALAEPLAALEELSRYMPHCVLVDRHMPLYDGSELADMLHERPDFAQLPIILLDEYTNDDGSVDARRELVATVRRCVDEAAATANPPIELGEQHSHYRRTWLLERLDATLKEGATGTDGLLDIGIHDVGELLQQLGMSTLIAIHNQLGKLLLDTLDNGDMLAENGAGYLLLSRGRDADHLRALAEDLCAKVRHERFGPSAVPISVTIGGCPIDRWLHRTDAVLAAAQRARLAATEGGIGWHLRQRDRVTASELQAALERDRLHLVYQAIVDLRSTPTPQYQALLRMRDSDGYVHTAAELFTVATDPDLRAALDDWALEQSLRLLAHQQQWERPLRLFVNQSAASVKRRTYPTQLATRLQAHGVPAASLVLTFQCDDIAKVPRSLITTAPRLQELGFGLCLSGFGRDVAHARLLDTLPLNFIKLKPELAAKPGALVPIAHARHIAVLAPQIEDRRVINQLRKLGVDYVQGHALAHPTRTLNYAFHAAAY